MISASALASADVATSISGPTTSVAGQTVTYVATTFNNGTYPASNNTVTVTLPSKPAANTVTIPSTATYDASTGVVTFAAADLATGATATNSVSFVTQATPTSVSGVAASTSATADLSAANNNGTAANATVTTTVAPTGAAGTAANCATAGKDGAASLNANPNAYYPSTAAQTLTGGTSTTIAVGAARGAATSIAPGDLLLIVQMQGANINTTDDASYGDGVAGGLANGTSVTTNFTAGTYEYVTVAANSATVTAGSGGTITLATALRNSYANAVATTTTGQRTFQVIRVPQYTNLTLTGNLVPAPWNGSTGGIVALDVDGRLNLNNFTIDASGMGFRGGAGRQLTGDGSVSNTTYRSSASLNTGGTKGEGIAGTPRYVNDPTYSTTALLDTRATVANYPTLLPAGLNDGYPSGDNGRGAPGNAGGGGTDANSADNGQNTGGGGGANGGRGGRGGNSWSTNQPVGGEPGAAFPAASSSRLVLGGGGGAGSTNNGTGTPGAGFASSGAAGGGAVLVRTGTLTGTGSILANGASSNPIAANIVGNDGSGGGGSGGSILVTVTNSQTATLTLTANGGAGGSNDGKGTNATAENHGPGGGGGGGVIFTNSVVAATATANGAASGITQPSGTAFGAEAGTIGVGNAAISNTIANSTAGANCIADVATTITGPASANAGSTVSLSVVFSNIGAVTAAGVTRTVTLPAGVLNLVATGGTITGSVLSGYTITYPATSLASAATNTYAITYTAPASGTVMANSAITTMTGQGGLTANDNSSAPTIIGLVADVTTALTGPQTVSPGQPTGTYTATFTNEGPSTASTVARTVTLPTGATNIIVNGATYTPLATAPNTIDFGSAATLASGATNAFTFSFTPATTATGTVAVISNITTSTSQDGTAQGKGSAPDASTINATVVPIANVATTITASPATLAAGTLATSGSSRFNVTFSNSGPSPAAGVVASVQLPTGLTNVSATNNPNGVYSPTTGVLTFPNITALTTNGSNSSIITFDVPATGPVVASSTISTTTNEAGQTANNKDSATLNVTPAFDLTTTITGPTAAVTGDLVTLAVTTTNNGPSAATNAVQKVQLATGLTNVYVSNGGVYNSTTTVQNIVSNGVTYSVQPGEVVFPTVASLPSGQTVANSISFAQPSTALSPVATVTPNTASNATTTGDTNTNNNTAYLNGNTSSTPLTILNPQQGTANAYTTITTSAASTTVGSPVTLTVTTGNRGPRPATGVTQIVQLVPGFTIGTLQVNGITGTTTAGSNVITFGTNGPTYNTLTGIVTFPTLTDGTTGTNAITSNGSTSGTSVTNTITLTPSAATATTVATTGTDGQLLAMAAVRTTNTDPVPADNVSSVAITLVQSTDLVTTLAGPTSAVPGQSVTYTASFINNGPMTATSVTESVQLPAGLGPNGVTITDGTNNPVSGATYSSTTGLVTFPNLATNVSGATQVFKLTFAAPAQSFAPSSSVNSSTPDAVGANNTASVATAVPASADLATTVAGPATAVVGNSVTYTVNTTNNGPAAATLAVTTLQLASGFSPSTLQVNGVTGTVGSGNTINYNLGMAGTATYNTSSGLVTFPSLAYLPVGATSSNYVSFVMPNATGGQTTGVASASAAGTDLVPTNNSASVATSIAPATTTSADLTATVSIKTPTNPTSVAPGAAVTYTATYGNIGTDAGVNVTPTLQLAPGLTTTTLPLIAGSAGTVVANSNLISYSSGAITYNTQTGVVTFPTIASQVTGTTGNVSYDVQVVAPSNGPLVATAVTASNTSEPATTAALLNNFSSVSLPVTPSFNEVTSINGPASALAGTSLTYTVTATNNGPSATSNVTTQTVTVPSGQTPTNITNSGSYSSTANTITWTILAGQAPGAAGAVANSFTIVQPTAGVSLKASVQVTGESNTDDNTATIPTTVTNRPPLAFAVVNALQNPQSNEAGGLANGLLISPLSASDPENSFATQKYTVVTIPDDTAQGTLYFNDGTATGTYSAVTAGKTLTDAQAKTLRFKAATSFVGNASFTYSTTDAANNVSPVVNYTIPVESDVDAITYVLTPGKGGNSNPYVTGDIIAFTTDANGAVYNPTAISVYQPNGVLQSGASNGIVSASEVIRAGVPSLSSVGLSVDNTGRIVVSNPGTPANPNLKPGTYSAQITTTDGNGGVTTQIVNFTISNNPLPVVLTAFTATAVQNRDAQLTWTTASEINSDYFDIERSFDGVSFAKVGQVAAQGTTALASNYAFTDAGVASRASGAVYYRLKQVDRDATATYSPVRTVSFSKVSAIALSLYPNPAQYATGLDLSQLPTAASYQVVLLDATGRQVRSATMAGGQVQPLNLMELATGTYHVLVTGKLADGSALRQTLRLTKD
ncbi:MAG: hypothetical protein ACRYF0_21120 [Janthinobacterium lividum]